jgi:hypothetical protein
MQNKRVRASKLVEGLVDEGKLWRMKITYFNEEVTSVVGDIFLH